ncbi:MAG TPA: DUF2975 domain-containing protein [Cyclobacteriaceae bacterium]|nr:DUF2975 domain-containing protein [Cyclobacteriaceae bacterium]
MKKTLFLTLTTVWFRISAVLVVLGFLYLTSLLIIYHFAPDYFGSKYFNLAGLFGQVGYSVQSVFHLSEKAAAQHPFALKTIKPFSFCVIYLQFSAILCCCFMIFREGIKIINSVKQLESFCKGNVASFQKMGKYFLFIFLLSGFAYVVADHAQFLGIFFNFTAFSLMVGSYIMAEIFKQGNVLQEEVQNTI